MQSRTVPATWTVGNGLLVFVLLAGCTSAPEHDDPAGLARAEVRVVETPAWPGSGEPNLATGADGRLYLSWIDPVPTGHALRFAVWEDDGWSPPRTIATGDRWFVNWADTPSMTALADGTLAAHWLAKSGDSTYAYDVWLSVSTDDGATWSDPIRPHDDGTQTEHGFVSLVPGTDGFEVVWLDGRQMADDPPGPMTLRHALLDRDGHVSPSRIIDDRVCDCCPTDAVRAGRALLLVYRDRSEDEIRDIWVARRQDDAWSPPQRLWEDGWKIAGCPVNGPAIAAARDSDDVVAAWFTVEGTRQGIVRVAFSADGGRSFGRPTRVDTGKPVGRVDVVRRADGSARVIWLEETEPQAALLVRDVAPDGTLSPARIVAGTSVERSSGYPKIAEHQGQNIVAWTEVGESPVVQSAILD